MRDDKVVPEGVVKGFVERRVCDQYLVLRWDLDPAKRRLMCVCESLERADELVHRDNECRMGSGTGCRTRTQRAESGAAALLCRVLVGPALPAS